MFYHAFDASSLRSALFLQEGQMSKYLINISVFVHMSVTIVTAKLTDVFEILICHYL